MSITRRMIVVFALVTLTAVPVFANHSWGGYHWARTSNPFTLKTGDNVNSTWDTYLAQAAADWSASSVLDLSIVAGQANPRNCRPTSGRIEVCNAAYGNNGWLGIAQIWLSGGTHISQATTKLNDTYFSTAQYNTPAWRRLVTCQEVAHDFGLDHQDETFDNANLGSCMDYTNDPDGGAGGASNNDPSNEHPNSHDFQQIQSIYQHLASTTTISSFESSMSAMATKLTQPTAVPGDDLDAPWRWGTPASWDSEGKPRVFVLDNGNGDRVVTHVFWAMDTPQGERRFDE
jgi:hypothetical protein